MKLPFVSRKEYELLDAELLNCKRAMQKLQEENLNLNRKAVENQIKSNGFEEENINLRSCYRDKCLEYQNLKEVLDARKELEEKLYDANFKLQEKISKFGMNAVEVLEREKNRQKKSRKKKQKQREIDRFIIDSVFEAILWEEK